jgi:uncharacterized protein (DUF433 family)
MSVTIAAEPSPLRVDDGGTIRIGTTRVTLDTLIAAFSAGGTPEQIAQDYPPLDLADIYASIAYYLRHEKELNEYLAKRQDAAEQSRQRNEHLYARGVRERLQARRDAQPKN